jgi:hypothetical protein
MRLLEPDYKCISVTQAQWFVHISVKEAHCMLHAFGFVERSKNTDTVRSKIEWSFHNGQSTSYCTT